MDEQRAWIKSRRKKWIQITVVILCFCLIDIARYAGGIRDRGDGRRRGDRR